MELRVKLLTTGMNGGVEGGFVLVLTVGGRMLTFRQRP
jgi:hypothetical protein